MTTPSMLSAVQKLRELLPREAKIKGLWMIVFALATSMLEVLTAALIAVLAQMLNQPEVGRTYLSKIGVAADMPSGRLVFYMALIVGVGYLIKNLVAAAEVFFQSFSIQRASHDFRVKMLSRYAQSDYGFYLTRNSSVGLSTVNNSAEQMFAGGGVSLACILSESFVFLALVSVVIWINPALAMTIAFVGGVVSFVLIKWVFPKFYQFGQVLQETYQLKYQALIQFFQGFKEITLSGKRSFFVDAYRAQSEKNARIVGLQVSLSNLPRMVLETLFVLLFVLAISVLCLGEQDPVQVLGILGGYLYVGFRLMPGLNRIFTYLNAFKVVIPHIEIVHQEYRAAFAKDNCPEVPDLQFRKGIVLQNLSFKYLNTEKDALSEVSFEIPKGSCVGIVGETGSGKSTLVDLVLGLLKPYKGSILVDGMYPVHSVQWHQKIGYVPQNIYLTDDSIEQNIAFGETEIDADRLCLAIDAAQLRKFIDALPEGSKTVVGERGVRLSGGERQRIAIARALYRQPEVLIFDEATSALDHETEEKVMETIYAISRDRTVIMIAHRLSTLEKCDRIIRVEGGRISEVKNLKGGEK